MLDAITIFFVVSAVVIVCIGIAFCSYANNFHKQRWNQINWSPFIPKSCKKKAKIKPDTDYNIPLLFDAVAVRESIVGDDQGDDSDSSHSSASSRLDIIEENAEEQHDEYDNAEKLVDESGDDIESLCKSFDGRTRVDSDSSLATSMTSIGESISSVPTKVTVTESKVSKNDKPRFPAPTKPTVSRTEPNKSFQSRDHKASFSSEKSQASSTSTVRSKNVKNKTSTKISTEEKEEIPSKQTKSYAKQDASPKNFDSSTKLAGEMNSLQKRNSPSLESMSTYDDNSFSSYIFGSKSATVKGAITYLTTSPGKVMLPTKRKARKAYSSGPVSIPRSKKTSKSSLSAKAIRARKEDKTFALGSSKVSQFLDLPPPTYDEAIGGFNNTNQGSLSSISSASQKKIKLLKIDSIATSTSSSYRTNFKFNNPYSSNLFKTKPRKRRVPNRSSKPPRVKDNNKRTTKPHIETMPQNFVVTENLNHDLFFTNQNVVDEADMRSEGSISTVSLVSTKSPHQYFKGKMLQELNSIYNR